MQQRPGDFGPAHRRLFGVEAEPSYRFEPGDLPLPEGLCYRLVQGGRSGEGPAVRVEKFLDEGARGRMIRIAREEALKDGDAEALRGALNRLVERPDFYSEGAFRGVDLPAEARALALLQAEDRGLVVGADARKLNRLALEAAFPAQIVPARERGEERRLFREVNAKLDLQEARRKYGPVRP